MTHKSVWSFFWKHIKPYKWYYLLMLTGPLYNSIHPIIYNYALKLFLDVLSQPNNSIQGVSLPIMFFVGNELMLSAIWRTSQAAEWKSEPFVRRSIILDSYNYIQYHSFEFFQNTFTGSITNKLNAIKEGYNDFWAEMHHGMLSKALTAVIGIFSLSLVYKNIALFLSVWAIIYSYIVYRLSSRLQQLSCEDSANNHNIIGQISDKLSNITSLLYYTARKQEHDKLDSFIKETFIPKQQERYKYAFFMRLTEDILFLSMFGVMLWYLLYLKTQNILSVGDFAFVFSMTLIISEKIWRVADDLQKFSEKMGDLQSAFHLLQKPQDNLDLPNAQRLEKSNPDIVFKNVSFEYEESEEEDQNLVLNNLSLTIKAGEKVGLVGKSGAGKSTIVKLLLQFFRHSSGDIIICDQKIDDITQESLRSHIAVIPQDTMLFHRSVIDNIRYGRQNATREEIVKATEKAHVHNVIMNMTEGYETMVGERGVKLSGGQRQRISIARAILKDAPILILDEATSSLDSQTESQIQDSLSYFIEDKQKTVIAIAHRLSTLKNMDRIIFLDEGKIVEEGTHDELLKKENGLYKKLWEYQKI